MKLNFGKRLLLFLHWLLSLLAIISLILFCVNPAFLARVADYVNQLIGSDLTEILCIVVLAVYALLSLLTLLVIFARNKNRADRSFISIDSSDTGRTRIAISAVEQMIRQAVRAVDGLGEMKCSIVNNDDSICISANVTLRNGAHVPTVTMNMKRAIRDYIELNCGVAVREISVNVNSVETPVEGKRGSKRNTAAAAPASAPKQAVQVAPEAAHADEIIPEPAMPVEEIPAEPAVEQAIPAFADDVETAEE